MAQLLIPVSTEDHVLGNPEALLSIVEYADFESPECRKAAEVMRRVVTAHRDDIVYAFRHFPLEELHPEAERAAEAAEAAGAQGEDKFWEMHDMLFANQDALDDDSLNLYADMIELNTEQFRADLEARVYAGRVHRDHMRALQNGTRQAPSFFVSNQLYAGVYSFRELLRAIRAGKRRIWNKYKCSQKSHDIH
ncbi:MAG: DsbA family protein [Candidatus Liptonbacteria bacterium]|nr:DsbA family protein [Candidatus Liptonbacteria bacterium]